MKKCSLLILCALLCMMSGCGSSKEENISDVTGKQMLVVGMDCHQQPFAYETDKQSEDSVVLGEKYCKGFDVSLARYLAKALQREISIVNMKSDQMVTALEEQTIDVAISALQIQDDDQVDVSSVYYEDAMVILVQKDSKLAKAKKLTDFAKKKLMAVSGTNADKAIDEIKDVVHESGASDMETLQTALKDKKCDAIVVPASIAGTIVKKDKNLVMISFEKEGFTTKNQYVIAMEDGLKEEEESLYHEVETVLAKIETGTKTNWMKENQ